METAALAIGVPSVLSEKSVMESWSLPFCGAIGAEGVLKGEGSLRLTMPEPARAPGEVVGINVGAADGPEEVVPGLAVVWTVVVRCPLL